MTYANALYNAANLQCDMNTGFLGNPAPSNGYDAVLAALAPQSAPAEGSLAGTAPSVHNNVKQTFINPVATYPFIARKWKHSWEQSFHPGDLMFVFTGRGGVDDKDTDVVHTRRHTILANLPTLNEIMRLALSDNDYARFANPDSWNFIGVMRNSSAASGLNPQDVRPRGGNALVPDRIINIDVRGATRMFNYWENATAGAHLWLAWRQLDMGAQYMSSLHAMGTGAPKRKRTTDVLPNGTNVKYTEDGVTVEGTIDSAVLRPDQSVAQYVITRNTGGRVQKSADIVTERDTATACWQLLPYSNAAMASGGQAYKPMKVWWSEQSVPAMQYKRPICAGWVYQGLGKGELSDNSVAIRKATQLSESRFTLPMVHAFLHV